MFSELHDLIFCIRSLLILEHSLSENDPSKKVLPSVLMRLGNLAQLVKNLTGMIFMEVISATLKARPILHSNSSW